MQSAITKACMAATFFAVIAPVSAEKGDKSVLQNPSVLKLESTFVGDREQPTVSYFVPWREMGSDGNLDWHIEDKYDQSLEVIDRDVVLRANEIYRQFGMGNVSP